jgi:hypothetical protein
MTLLTPSYGLDSISATLPAAAGALGIELTVNGITSADAVAAWGLTPSSRVVVVLMDGLGDAQLRDQAHRAPFLQSLLGDGATLRTGFPATTATSLASLGTGQSPGQTGLVGYTARSPWTGKLATLVSWTDADPPSKWQRAPHLFAELARTTAVSRVGPDRFATSGLTDAALSGGRYIGANSGADRVDATVRQLADPGLVYLYWGELDAIGHQEGWRSHSWTDALVELDRQLARLAELLPSGTQVVLIADHGMVDVTERVDVATTPELVDQVTLIGGEPRASHVYTDEPEQVARRWRDYLGDRVSIWLRDQAIAEGLFGQVAPHVVPMIGDVVVAAHGRFAVVDSRTQSTVATKLIGNHGSLTPDEAVVPLLRFVT